MKSFEIQVFTILSAPGIKALKLDLKYYGKARLVILKSIDNIRL